MPLSEQPEVWSLLNWSMDLDLCTLFEKLEVKGVTESGGLEIHMKKRAIGRSEAPFESEVLGEPMDTDGKTYQKGDGLLYLYSACTTIMSCFYSNSLPYNVDGGALLTTLPPYQSNVTRSEVSSKLRQQSPFGYYDEICSDYFAAFALSMRFKKLDKQMEVMTKAGEILMYDLYICNPGPFGQRELLNHGACEFGAGKWFVWWCFAPETAGAECDKMPFMIMA